MNEKRSGRKVFLGLLMVVAVCLTALAAAAKVKTVVDSASIKAAPQIGAKVLVKLPLNTILEVQDKQGEWYRVAFDKDGTPIVGYIHEMLVTEMTGETVGPEHATAAAKESTLDPAAEIEAKIETARESIRQQKDLAEAEESLDGLLAKVFRLGDPLKQKSLAVEIYLWIGLGRLASGNDRAALREFKKMFDVDPAAAKEATRNIAAPKVDALLKLAEQQSLGLISDFGLEVACEPPAAEVFIDGRDMGPTPAAFRWPSPQLVLELKKTGYVPIKEQVFLMAASTKKEYKLELLKRDLSLTSVPPGASVYIDGQLTDWVTDCRLEGLTYGPHELRLVLKNYQDWTGALNIAEDEKPELQAALIGTSYVPLASFGGKGSGLLDAPSVLAADKLGSLYVVDESEARVKKFTPKGEPVQDWKVQAPELVDLKTVASLAFDGQGGMWLVDSKRSVILKISPDGRSALSWNGQGGGTSEFRQPVGLAFDRAGNCYVLEEGNSRVKKYSARGDFLRTWGAEGTGNGQFILPRAIALDAQDKVYVLDKTRVQKFSPEGEFLASWGSAGNGEGQFENPRGLAVDAAGCVYVADTQNHRLQKFGADGRAIVRWGARGRDSGQLTEPVAVLADDRGNIFVLEKGNERLQVFGVGTPAAQR